MKLKFQVKCNGTLYKVGEYDGGMPKEIEKHFIDQGYFDLSAEPKKAEKEKKEPVDYSALSLEDIQKLSLSKLKVATKELSEDQLLELHELEEADDNPRDGAFAIIDGLLND